MARPLEDRLRFLRKTADIERVKREGRRVQTPFFNLVTCPSATAGIRVGIVVSKRLGGAVRRNRVKRIFRELARRLWCQLGGGRDLVVFPKREALLTPPQTLRESWTAALRREGVLVSDSGQQCKRSVSI